MLLTHWAFRVLPAVMSSLTNGLTSALCVFLIFTLISSTVLARPFTNDQLLQKFMADSELIARQPIAYSNFESADQIPYRTGIKRQIQGLFIVMNIEITPQILAFADPTSSMGKMKAMNILRAMVNFRRY